VMIERISINEQILVSLFISHLLLACIECVGIRYRRWCLRCRWVASCSPAVYGTVNRRRVFHSSGNHSRFSLSNVAYHRQSQNDQ